MRLIPFAVPVMAMLTVACLALPAAGYLSLTVNDTWGNHSSYTHLKGSIKIVFDEFLPNASVLYFYFDGSPAPDGSLGLGDYIGNESEYETGVYDFSYSVTANGAAEWKEFPDQEFSYGVTAYGSCGNENCNEPECCPCYPEPYPCGWAISFYDIGTAAVRGDQGLVEIYNASESITIPSGANNDTRWVEVSNNNPNVNIAMMERCETANSGWITRDLTDFQEISGTTSKKTVIEHFNHTSLSEDRKDFQPDCQDPVCGGLYEKSGDEWIYLDFVSDCDNAPSETAHWNGTTGEITICYFKGNADYMIKYLPYNGPMICAYTSNYTTNISAWAGNHTEEAQTSNENPFSMVYTTLEMPYAYNSTTYFTALIQPDLCPGYAYNDLGKDCNITVASYSVSDDQPDDPVKIIFDEAKRMVNATTSKTKLAGNYSITVEFANISGLVPPSALGQHSILFSLMDGGQVLAETNHTFFICRDSDEDGYCVENGDCDNNDNTVYPGRAEKCNGIDDNCDGRIDEGFANLGEPCGSAYCEGRIVCTTDGNGTVCSSDLTKGVEICGNGIDDDCDGEVDEAWEQLDNGSIVQGCFCMPGETSPCGSNIGECSQGEKLCKDDYTWGDCVGQILPSEEVCNGKDDNCDGIVDNIGAETGKESSVEDTKCGCYGGRDPADESRNGCNGIDDNCDGRIDEGLVCCQNGQERECGSSVGVCRPGREKCINGQWSGECNGGVQPGYEICYDNLDNDCDGLVDESGTCNPDITCKNRRQDLNEDGIDCGGPCPNPCGIPLPLILLAAGIIVVIVAVMIMALGGSSNTPRPGFCSHAKLKYSPL